MNIIPWKHNRNVAPATRDSQEVSHLRNEVDRLFDRFFTEPWGGFPSGFMTNGEYLPSLDVVEDDTSLTVRVEVPGLKPEELDIQIEGDVLTITGSKEERGEHKHGNVFHSERRFGRFRRSVALPAHVDTDDVQARCEHGVLTVTLARSEKARPKKVAVKAG